MSDAISELVIERYVLGEATAAEKARVEGSPDAMARVASLRRENEALLASHPPANVAAVVRARSADVAKSKLGHPFLWLAPMVTVACALLFVVLPRGDGDIETTRPKGLKTHLAMYLQVGATSAKLTNGALVRTGDTVQVAYVAADATYGVILSVDGRGNVTRHTPATGDGKLSQRSEVLLPRAYTLDDAPRFERFVFIAGARPVDVARLQKVLHETPEIEADKLRESFGGTVDVFTLRKEP